MIDVMSVARSFPCIMGRWYSFKPLDLFAALALSLHLLHLRRERERERPAQPSGAGRFVTWKWNLGNM